MRVVESFLLSILLLLFGLFLSGLLVLGLLLFGLLLFGLLFGLLPGTVSYAVFVKDASAVIEFECVAEMVVAAIIIAAKPVKK